jgi:hypothetical protein
MPARGDAIDAILDFLARKGIDPLVPVTLVLVLVSASYFKDLKTWRTQPPGRKSIVAATFFAAIVVLLIDVIELVSRAR